MNPTESNQQLAQNDPSTPNPLSVMQPGEQVICNVKRHPIGLLGMYIAAGVMLLVLAILVFGVVPHFVTSISRNQVYAVGGLIFIVLALLSLGFLVIASRVYWGNYWVVTTDSVTEITRRSLFEKQSSQLSLGNLEDVTVTQNGLLAHMLNYGVIRAETAGERSNFIFPYCPNPNHYAQQILNARERFEMGRRAEEGNPQALYRGQGDYAPAPTFGQPPMAPPNQTQVPVQPPDRPLQPSQTPPQITPPNSADLT